MKKTSYLLLALLLPGLIFVFLKFAGKNEFAIPVLYEEGVDSPPADCPGPYSRPYTVDLGRVLTGSSPSYANVMVFSSPGRDGEEIKLQLEQEMGAVQNRIELLPVYGQDSALHAQWKSCLFLLKDPWQTALVDGEGRIRGQYDLRSREELDRLRVELKILLKKY